MALTGSGVRVGLVDLDYLAPGIGERTGEAGHDICRDQVARLMPARNIQGVSRQRRKAFTTRQDPAPVGAPELVERIFIATAPNELWVTDLTRVLTRSAMAYVCFIVDAFCRKILGWKIASHMRTAMVLNAPDPGTTSMNSNSPP